MSAPRRRHPDSAVVVEGDIVLSAQVIIVALMARLRSAESQPVAAVLGGHRRQDR